MVKRKQGSIFFTGASAGLRSNAKFAPFASAKMALRGVAQGFAKDLGPQGVHVAHLIVDGLVKENR
eukprot:UN09342